MAAWKRYIGVLALGLLLVVICGIGIAQETDTINFGGVPVGQTGTASYTFKILEASETSATVTIYPPSPPFGLQDAPTGSFTLAPGQSITFGVTFTPTATGDYTGSFTITAQGGSPVQEKTTTVYLTGHAGSGGEAPPRGETPPTPGITIPFPLFPPPAEAPAGAVPGTTDEEGKFKLALSPTTTIAGRLTRCEDGGPLPSLPFQLAKTDAGFSLFASGYEEKDITKFSKFSIMGLESYDLGDVCLTPSEQEPGTCPCCSITMEALMCCSPTEEYVETDTVYESQSVRFRVSYCEPTKEFEGVDLTTVPLTNTGGVLWDPGLMPNPPSATETPKIGITSIMLDDKTLYSGDGQLTKTVSANWLTPGSHTVRATIGRFNGQVCVCEKTFQVLACPKVNAQVKETIEPNSGCSPVRVTYDLDWPEGSNICRVLYQDHNDMRSLQGFDSFPITKTYSTIAACVSPYVVKPWFSVLADNCCTYEFLADPFTVKPPFKMSDDCICLRLKREEDGSVTAQVSLKPDSPEKRGHCVPCEELEVKVDWGDGTVSEKYDVVRDFDTGQVTVDHRYEADPDMEEQRPDFDIKVDIKSPCGHVSKSFTTRCPFPDDLVSEDKFSQIQHAEGSINDASGVYNLVNALVPIFNLVGASSGQATICSVLLDISLKGIDMGEYADFDKLLTEFNLTVAGGIFGGRYSGNETGTRRWRFYNGTDASAKLVYIPGDRPFFGLTILRGSCDNCPVLPAYRIISTLTDEQAKKRIDEAERGLNAPGATESTAFADRTISVILEIELCCHPDMCAEAGE